VPLKSQKTHPLPQLGDMTNKPNARRTVKPISVNRIDGRWRRSWGDRKIAVALMSEQLGEFSCGSQDLGVSKCI
jgi:hypothetical protein